ncbi:MAG: hypothetical protein VX944_00015 [Myxococcota bacterium]|nr:hypothetical protein [Myxococcota bacterium]MEC9388435.1 hypothetical protein [Myxococcota bacterium]
MRTIIPSLIPFALGCPQPVEQSAAPASTTAAVAYSPISTDVPLEARMGQTVVSDQPGGTSSITAKQADELQAKIRAGHHTVFSGEVVCSGCTGPFILKVGAFVRPSPTASSDQSNGGTPQAPACGVGGHGADVRFPPIVVAKPGPFEIAFPWHGYPVVVEVHEDSNGDGTPGLGERFAVLHEGGALMGNEDQTGLEVNLDRAPQMVGDGSAAPVGQGLEDRTSP